MVFKLVLVVGKASSVKECEGIGDGRVNNCEDGASVSNDNASSVKVDELTSLSIGSALVYEIVSGISDKIALRMAEEIAAIYVVGPLTKMELKRAR